MLVVTSDLLSVSFTVARKSMMSTKGLLSAAGYREQDTCRYRSHSVNSGAIYEIEVEFNCQNIFRYNDRKLRSHMGSMFNDSLCFADCCPRVAARPVVFWQPCTWNGNSPCLTVDSSHRPRPECCWKSSIENVLTLWILVLAKTHFNRGRW